MPRKRNTCSDCGTGISPQSARCQSCNQRQRHAARRSDVVPPNPSGLCLCGCGQPTPIATQTRRYRTRPWLAPNLLGHPCAYVTGHDRRTSGPEYVVDEATGCWVWNRGVGSQGRYGTAYRPGKGITTAHRVVYERHRGPIPDGLELDHTCPHGPNTLCVNPDHLEPVTHAENQRRMGERQRRHG